MSEIAVSVIVPVYNAEKYLRQCLDSIVSQTLRDIEIICVDDGSSDSSVDILKEYAARDPRLSVLCQKNSYAGVARNTGKSAAKGKYLVFWDADDYFFPTALEDMYKQCEKDSADICLCSGRQFYENEQIEVPGHRYIRKKEIPDRIPFNRLTAPDSVLTVTVAAVWNKMFLRSFVEACALDFHPTRNANDVFFVEMAMCLAERITLIDKPLICYRKSKPEGLVSSLSKGIMVALREWIVTAEELRRLDAFPADNYANKALESILYILNNTADWEAYKEGFLLLQNGGLEKMGIRSGVSREFYHTAYHYDAAELLLHGTPEQFVKWMQAYYYFREDYNAGKLRSLEARNRQLEKENRYLRSSFAYRTGKVLMWLPSTIYRTLHTSPPDA